jgi:hypothetical protein
MCDAGQRYESGDARGGETDFLDDLGDRVIRKIKPEVKTMTVEQRIQEQKSNQRALKDSFGHISQKGPKLVKPQTRSRHRKALRDMSELAVLEAIQRIKAVQRASPKSFDCGYNSAVTQLELFLAEIKAKQWDATEL